MEYAIKIKNSIPFFVLHYNMQEQKELKRKMTEIGYTESTTERGFNTSEKVRYYRVKTLDKTLSSFLKINSERIKDDINSPLFSDGLFNLAILRVRPSKNGYVRIRLEKYLTIADFRDVIVVLNSAYKQLFNVLFKKKIIINME